MTDRQTTVSLYPADIADADEIAVLLTARERKPVARSEAVRRALAHYKSFLLSQRLVSDPIGSDTSQEPTP